jgi:hypothetical protein
LRRLCSQLEGYQPLFVGLKQKPVEKTLALALKTKEVEDKKREAL